MLANIIKITAYTEILNAFKWVACPFKCACDDGLTSGKGANGIDVDTGISAFVVLLLLLLCSVIFGNESGIGASGTIGSVAIVVSVPAMFGTVDWLMPVVSGIGAKGTTVEGWGNGIFDGAWAKGTFNGAWANGTFVSDAWTAVGAAAAKFQI